MNPQPTQTVWPGLEVSDNHVIIQLAWWWWWWWCVCVCVCVWRGVEQGGGVVVLKLPAKTT